MENLAEHTLADIVLKFHQSAAVLEKYQLDFCCKGRRTLKDACAEKGLDPKTVIADIKESFSCDEKPKLPFEEMSAEQLINYILIHHHFYVKQSMPSIFSRLQKIADKHGDKYPYILEVMDLFAALYVDMTSHLQKEETIVFPRIKEIEHLYHSRSLSSPNPNFINGPIHIMESEHEEAGAIMQKIKDLTNNYEQVDGACTTFNLTLAELKEFEEDLHKHVHLENYILFPLAEKILHA